MLIVALCVVSCLAGSLPRPSFVRSAQRAAIRSRSMAQDAAKKRSVPAAQWFQQRMDHFGQVQGTFKQRYWIDESYYNAGLPGPLFVQLGEEAAAGPEYATSLAMATYGQKHGALLLAIEHRYFGASQPFTDYSDMSLLSVDQGLADFAAVIESVRAQYNATNVVVYGCSYIGAGASWFRAKYPQLVAGAVASSPPVLAVADFYKYLDQVELSIKEQFGVACDNNIRQGFAATVDLITSGSSQLVKQFNLCSAPKTSLDVSTFVMSVASSVMGVVQYDNEIPGNNIDAMCSLIGNASSPLEGLSHFFVAQSSSCNDILYADFIASLSNTTYHEAAHMRQWTWMTCTQFGYFQTTTNSNQPFAQGDYVPLSYYEQMCKDAFGQDFDVEANVANTNLKFGGNQLPSYFARNIVYDNSVVDPWHTLSVQSSPNPESPLILYEVRGHCAAVSAPNPNDPPSIQAVRDEVAALVNEWVSL